MPQADELMYQYLRRRLSRRDALRAMGLGTVGLAAAACAPGTPTFAAPSGSAAAGSPPPAASPGSSDSINGLLLSDFTKADIDWQRFKGAELNVLMFSIPPESTSWRDAIKAFEAVSGAKVSVTELAQAELGTKALADLTSKAGGFDVINVEFALIPDFAKPGLIEPLDPYIENPDLTDPAWLDLDDIFTAPLVSGQWSGKQYAIPIIGESSILCYRSDLIDKAPDTFEEFAAVARAAKVSTRAGVALRGQRGAGLNVYIWSAFLYGFGGDFVVDYPNDLHPTVNSSAAVQAVDYYASLLRDAGPAGAATYTNEEVQIDAQNDATAMLIEWSGVPILIDNRAASQTAGLWAFAQVPKGPAGRFPSLYSTVFSLNANSKNKEAGWGLLQALTAPASALHYAPNEVLATRKSVADSPVYQEISRESIAGFDQWVPVNSEALATAKADYVPRIPHWQEFGDRVGIALQSVIAGQTAAQAAMDQAQKDITKLLTDADVI